MKAETGRPLFLPATLYSLLSTVLRVIISPQSEFPSKLILMKRKLLDIARRLLILLLVVWTVVSLVTILIELVPGDPATAILGDQATPEALEQFRQRHGLDRPAFFFSYAADEDDGP